MAKPTLHKDRNPSQMSFCLQVIMYPPSKRQKSRMNDVVLEIVQRQALLFWNLKTSIYYE